MNTTDKNKWLAVITALVVVSCSIGGYFIYQKSSQNGGTVDALSNASSTSNSATVHLLNSSSTQSIKHMDTPITPTTPAAAAPVTLADGLIIQDLAVGTGDEAKSGQTIAVHYAGTLENGTKFDSSYDRGQPFSFILGVGQVIRGWDEGVVGMKVGGKRKLIIPSTLGYGSSGAGDKIPPNATLVFTVELLAIKK